MDGACFAPSIVTVAQWRRQSHYSAGCLLPVADDTIAALAFCLAHGLIGTGQYGFDLFARTTAVGHAGADG